MFYKKKMCLIVFHWLVNEAIVIIKEYFNILSLSLYEKKIKWQKDIDIRWHVIKIENIRIAWEGTYERRRGEKKFRYTIVSRKLRAV